MTTFPHHISEERLKRLETNVHYEDCPDALDGSDSLCDNDCLWELVNELLALVKYWQTRATEAAS